MLFYGAIFGKVLSATTRYCCGCIANVNIIFVFEEALMKWTYRFINYIGLVWFGLGVFLQNWCFFNNNI